MFGNNILRQNLTHSQTPEEFREVSLWRLQYDVSVLNAEWGTVFESWEKGRKGGEWQSFQGYMDSGIQCHFWPGRAGEEGRWQWEGVPQRKLGFRQRLLTGPGVSSIRFYWDKYAACSTSFLQRSCMKLCQEVSEPEQWQLSWSSTSLTVNVALGTVTQAKLLPGTNSDGVQSRLDTVPCWNISPGIYFLIRTHTECDCCWPLGTTGGAMCMLPYL